MHTVSSFFGLLIVVLQIISHVDTYRIAGNLCWSMPCLNGGSCFGSFHSYMCVCPINYSGALCEKRLGICQRNPCENRGLCIEKNLTSFECRCYYNYIGPTCEEHVKNTKRSVWSSMLPVHTQILFNMLQDAYRVKAKGRIMPAPRNGQIDFLALLAAFTSATTPRIEIVNSTNQIKTTQSNLIIPANNIQLEKLFPKAKKQNFQSENFTTMEMMENITITSIAQTTFDYSDTTEEEELTDVPTSTLTMLFDEENSTIAIDDPMNETISSTESNLSTIVQSMDTSEMNSSPSLTTVPTNQSQLLNKLCQRILSHIVPNVSSSINSSSILSNTANETLNALLSWLNNYLNSTKHTMTTTPTTPTSLVTEEIPSSSDPLQRIDMDDIFHQMDNYADDETIPH